MRKTNVILLTIDCLKADHLSCLGYPKNITPNIDNLAKRGALFCEAISNGPVTPFSFPSILTSSYPLVYPLKYIGGPWPAPILVGRVTLAEILKRQGYSTAAVHSNPYLSAYFNYNRGFEFFVGAKDIALDMWARFNAYTGLLGRMQTKIYRKIFPAGCHNPSDFIHFLCGNVPYARANMINQVAISWLETNDPEPFFMWLHYMDPHDPCATKKLVKNLTKHISFFFKRFLHEHWPSFCSTPQNDLYDEEIKYVDHEIGLLFEKLKDIGIWLDNSLIILTADHGGPLHTLRLYDSLLRVPLIVSGPEIKGHLRIEEQVSLLDLAPTITDILGVRKVKSFQGESLLPLLEKEERKKKGVISEYQSKDKKGYSYRTKDWKYIFTLDEKGKHVELYDLQNDPEETKNLAKKEEWRTLDFQRRIEEHMAMEELERARSIGKEKEVYSKKDEEEITRRLKALGYI